LAIPKAEEIGSFTQRKQPKKNDSIFDIMGKTVDSALSAFNLKKSKSTLLNGEATLL